MKTYKPNEIKNIALVGSAGSGKTTLAEAMMYEGGVIPRRGSVSAKNFIRLPSGRTGIRIISIPGCIVYRMEGAQAQFH